MLLDLRSCTQYDFQLESYRKGQASGYSEMVSFKTLGCKEADDINDEVIIADGDVPDRLETSQITATDAVANWAPVSGAIGYKFQYKMLGGGMVRTKKLRGTSVRMTDLGSWRKIFLSRPGLFQQSSRANTHRSNPSTPEIFLRQDAQSPHLL